MTKGEKPGPAPALRTGPEFALEAQDIAFSFGGFLALDSVSVQVERGGLVGLIGPNGAGKSTLFAVLSGFEAPNRGRVAFEGEDVTDLSPPARARRGLGRTFQTPREFARLTVRQNLMAAAPGQSGESLASVFLRPGRVRAEEDALARRADDLLAFLNLSRVADQPASGLSGGQKKLLELGRVLMLGPRLVLLDEPFAGVNPVLIREIAARIRDLNRDGIGFLIVEHNLQALAALVPRLYVMDRGRIIAEGAPRSVLADRRVQEAYMGGVL